MNYDEIALNLHQTRKGKLEITPKVPIESADDLSAAYTPGVGAVCKAIAEDVSLARTYTIKHNSVAVVTDGSAVLGLGNIGPEAALPVMEGKAVLFKQLAGIDAYPICLNTQDPEAIVDTIAHISAGFAGINLEDISAPNCFAVEAALRERLDIPVVHDDQHGTAVVVLAGLLNALKVVGKQLSDVRVVISGAGAAGYAVAHLLHVAGVRSFAVVDSRGVISADRTDLVEHKRDLADITQADAGTLADAVEGADVFIGVSAAGILTADMVRTMNEQAIVFALANPEPEIYPHIAREAGAAVVATGRSDFPNQINNVLAFPGMFRGFIDAGIVTVTNEIWLACADAIADCVAEPHADQILPSIFDPHLVPAIVNKLASIGA